MMGRRVEATVGTKTPVAFVLVTAITISALAPTVLLEMGIVQQFDVDGPALVPMLAVFFLFGVMTGVVIGWVGCRGEQ